jgi:hypothetical protein
MNCDSNKLHTDGEFDANACGTYDENSTRAETGTLHFALGSWLLAFGR